MYDSAYGYTYTCDLVPETETDLLINQSQWVAPRICSVISGNGLVKTVNKSAILKKSKVQTKHAKQKRSFNTVNHYECIVYQCDITQN